MLCIIEKYIIIYMKNLYIEIQKIVVSFQKIIYIYVFKWKEKRKIIYEQFDKDK